MRKCVHELYRSEYLRVLERNLSHEDLIFYKKNANSEAISSPETFTENELLNPLLSRKSINSQSLHAISYWPIFVLKMLFPFVRVVQRGTKSSFFISRNIRFSPIVSNKSSGMFTVISTSRIQKCSFINPVDYMIVESELLAWSWSLTGEPVRRKLFPPQRNSIPKHEDGLTCKWLTAIVS